MKIPSTTIDDFKIEIVNLRKAILRPPPNLTVPDWADRYRRLSGKSGAVAGKWTTERVEVARGPMMAVTEPGVRIISVMASTQTLKTSLLENVTGYYMHLDPGPLLIVQPKDQSVDAFSKERIAPMIRATPVLRDLISDNRSRISENTIGFKSFPGGFLAIVSAGSPSNLAMRAIKFTGLDEIDKYQPTREGDPIKLAEERTSTFQDEARKIRVCSPTLKETSRIYKSYLDGDMRRPFAQCPHCHEWIHLNFFSHVHWDKLSDGTHMPDTAAIYCSQCGAAWTESDRMRVATTKGAIRHMQTKAFLCCGVEQIPEKWDWCEDHHAGYALCALCDKRAVSNHHASFQVSKLFSPFKSLADLAQDWLDSQADEELKQVFFNTQLGLPYEQSARREIHSSTFLQRTEKWDCDIPQDGVVLTCGIDVQSHVKDQIGRLELETVAWGNQYESWSIDVQVFKGDLSRPDIWHELDAYLMRPFRHETGTDLRIMSACIDTGGHSTQEVYKFARTRFQRNIWAIKGASDRTTTWSPVWPAGKNLYERFKTAYKPIIIGVNAAKEAVKNRLSIDVPGPGYCHFPEGRAEAWFDQLLAEDLITITKGGIRLRKWRQKSGRANEAFDCRVYAYAALIGLEHVRNFDMEKHIQNFYKYVDINNKGKVIVKPRRHIRKSW